MAQVRNEHNLMKDFREEVAMYLQNDEIYHHLEKMKLRKGEKYYLENLIKCYKSLVKKGIINKKELFFLNAWARDIKSISK